MSAAPDKRPITGCPRCGSSNFTAYTKIGADGEPFDLRDCERCGCEWAPAHAADIGMEE